MRAGSLLAWGALAAVSAVHAAPGREERVVELRREFPAGEEYEGLRRVLDDLRSRIRRLNGGEAEWERTLDVVDRLRPGLPPLGRDQRLLGNWIEAMGRAPARAGWEGLRVDLAQAVLDHGGLVEAAREPYRRLAAARKPAEVAFAVEHLGRVRRAIRTTIGILFLLPLGLVGLWWWRRRRYAGTRAMAVAAEDPSGKPAPGPSPPVTGAGAWISREGRFSEVVRLGAGGMGTVFGAREVETGRAVAIKTLASLDAMDEEMCGRFLREAKALERIDHPGLPAVFAVAEQPVPHMVMEKVEGMSLEELAEWESPLEPDRVRRWMREAGAALGAAHAAGVIHRDVKPANLMVDDDDHVRVVDFGLAFLADHTRLTRTGQAVGTPAFMPREQLMGEAPSMSTDVYGLCATAYYLLVGEFPYHPMMVLHGGDLDPPRFPEELPGDLLAALQGGLRPAREDRLRTVDELLEILED